MKFVVDSFGCRSNQAEIQEWIIELEKLGYELTTSPALAAFGILNTCSVTEKAEKDVRRFVEQGLSQHPHQMAYCRLHGQPGQDGAEPQIQELFFF